MKQKDIKYEDDKTTQHCKVFVSGHHQHNYFQVPIFFKTRDKQQMTCHLQHFMEQMEMHLPIVRPPLELAKVSCHQCLRLSSG